MKFNTSMPKVNCIKELPNFGYFLQCGQEEFCNFLKNFLDLDQVRIQVCGLDELKKWLNVESITEIMDVPGANNEICVVSQIQYNGELIAYFPYVLKGKNVKKYLKTNSFLSKLSEAVSDQITSCYLQRFKGGDWVFGENLARVIVSNCISTRKYDGIKFVHLIEKFEQLAASTFENAFFTTGVIVSEDLSKYRDIYFKFKEKRNIDNIAKREWFLADGKESFFCWIPILILREFLLNRFLPQQIL